jgi:hypothetical protein
MTRRLNAFARGADSSFAGSRDPAASETFRIKKP